MISVAKDYEAWFRQGHRETSEFLQQHDLDRSQFRELLLTDQFLRHQSGESINVGEYVQRFDRLAHDAELQIEMWLEAFGYLEESQDLDVKDRELFLAGLPANIRDAVESEILLDSPSAAEDAPPNIERYRVDGEIGRGTFGVVYRAWDQQLDRAVAIKVIRSGQSSDDLFAEARVVAKLDVPGIISVYDCGIESGGRAFLVTSYVNGPDLKHWADSVSRQDFQRISKVFIELCRSLQLAHESGIVHRDIKPTNIIVQSQDRPVLLDFGLATGNWQPGRQGELVGTPAYMSPEQARGEAHLVDPRSDVFSVGVLLIETLTGQRPWQSRSSRELVREIAHGQMRSVRQLNASVPAALERICSKATSAAMSQRYSSAAELADELEWFCEQQANAAASPAEPEFIAPRGLRPYRDSDSTHFWSLLPGPRNGRGVPDSVRWWLEQLQVSLQNPSPRSVLVLYGPSGSGKSSLLQAGVLPFLNAAESQATRIDASELDADQPLAAQIAPLLGISDAYQSTLAELFTKIREGGPCRKVIVWDQFEQLLTCATPTQREQITLALRQADGLHLQFVLVARDEFWTSISRFMHDLDAPLRDGRNAMSLERFSRRHAAAVLKNWSQALGNKPLSAEFIENALDLVADDDRVIPVRLALLANILGDDWTEERLAHIASQGSLSGYYLESVLGDLAPAARKRFTKSATAVLRCLTPPTGKIRGTPKSSEELQAVCRNAEPQFSDTSFDDLIDLMDRQLQLLTPVEHVGDQPARHAQTAEQSGPSRASSTARVFYQLSHDFLVVELRTWLDAYDRKTVRGRALIDLRAASQRWNSDPQKQNLAGPIDCLRFGLVARPTQTVQRTYVRASAGRQLFRAAGVASLATIVAMAFQVALWQMQGREIVQRILTSEISRLPAIVEEARKHDYWTRLPLQQAWDQAEQTNQADEKDRIALTRLVSDPSLTDYLVERLPKLSPDEARLLAGQMNSDLLDKDRDAVVNRLASIASDESCGGTQRLKAAIAIGIMAPEHRFWDDMGPWISRLLVEANPTDLGWLSEGLFPVRQKLLQHLADLRSENDAAQTRTATFLQAKFAADDITALVKLVAEADFGQLGAIFPAVASAPDEIDRNLRTRFDESVQEWHKLSSITESLPSERSRHVPGRDAQLVAASRRIGSLGAALLMRGHGDAAMEQLAFRSDPTVRGYLIECYAFGNGPAHPLVNLLLQDAATGAWNTDIHPSCAAALLQMLGSLPASSQVPSSIRALAKRVYQESSNLELNASAEWFLRKNGYAEDLKPLTICPQSAYRTSEGHTMVRLPGGIKTTVGASPLDRNRMANEDPREIEIPQEIYISRNELRVEQLQRFRLDTETDLNSVIPANAQGAAMRLGFFEAAAYCNWLSEKEGIPESEWCYIPNAEGEIGPGMQIADDHLSRSGFQIPTPDLWEYACRGGTTTPKSFGFGSELSSGYVRWMGTRSAHNQRFAIRKPNGFGLFDMLGNSAEWSVGVVDRLAMYGPTSRRPGPRVRGGFEPPPADRGPPPGSFGPPSEDLGPQSRRPPRIDPTARNGRAGLGFGGGPILADPAGKTIDVNSQFVILGGAFDSPAHKIRSSDRSILSPPITNKPITLRLMRIVLED